MSSLFTQEFTYSKAHWQACQSWNCLIIFIPPPNTPVQTTWSVKHESQSKSFCPAEMCRQLPPTRTSESVWRVFQYVPDAFEINLKPRRWNMLMYARIWDSTLSANVIQSNPCALHSISKHLISMCITNLNLILKAPALKNSGWTLVNLHICLTGWIIHPSLDYGPAFHKDFRSRKAWKKK